MAENIWIAEIIVALLMFGILIWWAKIIFVDIRLLMQRDPLPEYMHIYLKREVLILIAGLCCVGGLAFYYSTVR